MRGILNLPCEVVGSVLRSFDNVHCLLPALLTCRHFYASFQETPGVAATVLRRQVDPKRLPFSIAILEASNLPHPRSPVLVKALLDKLYHRSDELAAQASIIPTRDILMLGRVHDVIESLATDFLSQAWARLGLVQDDDSLAIAPMEFLSACRAFYLAELCIRAFCQDPNREPDFDDRKLVAARNLPLDE